MAGWLVVGWLVAGGWLDGQCHRRYPRLPPFNRVQILGIPKAEFQHPCSLTPCFPSSLSPVLRVFSLLRFTALSLLGFLTSLPLSSIFPASLSPSPPPSPRLPTSPLIRDQLGRVLPRRHESRPVCTAVECWCAKGGPVSWLTRSAVRSQRSMVEGERSLVAGDRSVVRA